QDTQEPNLVFLGTEHGLWISTDKGDNWVQFKNGFPSVSTMDLKIQESESALVVGTFGRAIWVLDDLWALRAAAGGTLQQGVTALPTNEVVQVKGLFINPPGNIWTGFHTTFEGENKVFQKMQVPYYIEDSADTLSTITALVHDPNGKLINILSTKPKREGLNYLTWKLDEQASILPGAWINDESRGIPVLPGSYKIVLEYKGESDSNVVKVIPDPRFELDPAIDQQLYAYQKEVDLQVGILGTALRSVDQKRDAVSKLKQQILAWDHPDKASLLKLVKVMKEKLDALRASGQTPRPKRQVGAWQTSLVTPYTNVRNIQQIAMSRTRSISEQEKELVQEASEAVELFRNQVDGFEKGEWQPFVQQMRQAGFYLPAKENQ
ncbi:MAG: hypothetical protein KTR30_30180, partial [Saprospiraceae bacterium]|nr:hypothetical protein [Saprospiraceae bacterium]